VIWSRRGTDLTDRFPTVALAAQQVPDGWVDGELVCVTDGRVDVDALARTSSSRRPGGELRVVAFDLLGFADEDTRRFTYSMRRLMLTRLLAGMTHRVFEVCASTGDRDEAAGWVNADMARFGVEGVVAKRVDGRYVAGGRSGWVKTRWRDTVDTVVVGYTGSADRPWSLVVGTPDVDGRIRVCGRTAPLSTPVAAAVRDALPDRVPGDTDPDEGYTPVAPGVVVEVVADGVPVQGRWRLPVRAVRVREGVDPLSVPGV
jgi:bifunctional non-homologous end joining protein LigD